MGEAFLVDYFRDQLATRPLPLAESVGQASRLLSELQFLLGRAERSR